MSKGNFLQTVSSALDLHVGRNVCGFPEILKFLLGSN